MGKIQKFASPGLLVYFANNEAAIIASVLAILGVLFFIKTVFFTEKEEDHQPGYMSNKKAKKNISYQ